MSRMAASALGRVVAGLLVASLAVLGLQARGGDDRVEVVAEFAEAGLNFREGYEVRVLGVPAGRVTAVDIDRSDFSARYTLALDPDRPVAADTTAQLVPKTVFGDKYMALEPAAPGQPRLGQGDVIPRDRTSSGAEVQDIIDEVVPMLRALEPERFGATLASLGEGLAGGGDELGRIADGWSAAMEELVAREDDLATLLDHVPGVAGTMAERSDDLAAAARHLSRVAEVMGDNEAALGQFLSENAELANQVAELLAPAPGRLGRVIPDMVDVVATTASHPGRVATFAKYWRFNIRGTANIYKSGWVRIRESTTVIMNPGTWADAPPPYGEFDGGTGIFPDVYVHGFPNENFAIPPPEEEQTTATTGAGQLLAPLTGGGR